MEQLELEFLYEHPVYKEYACDGKGNVYSMNYRRTGKTRKLKPSLTKKGYLHFGINKDGKVVARPFVHRFVWECIKGEIQDGYDVDHLDFNRQNNCIENLLARPAKENRARTSDEGRNARAENGRKHCSKPVIQLDLEENFIAEFPSIIDAERQTGIVQQSISACCKGKLKSAGGKKWKYKDIA